MSRLLTGLLTVTIIAFVLSWFLPEPEAEETRDDKERLVTMDLTQPDSQPQELVSGDADGDPPADSMDAVSPAPDKLESAVAAVAPDPAVPANAPVPPLPPIPPEGANKPEVAAAPAPPLPNASVSPQTPPQPAKPSEPKPVPTPAPKTETKPQSAAIAVAPKAAPKPVAKPAAAKAAVAKGPVTVQAGAYSNLSKAEGVRGKARALGVDCVISPADTAKGTMYRLRCGPFDSRANADAAVKKLSAKKIDAQILIGG
ncbi:MAG: SPOR domain-containing protein [Panacagrimonas sp.]